MIGTAEGKKVFYYQVHVDHELRSHTIVEMNLFSEQFYGIGLRRKL